MSQDQQRDAETMAEQFQRMPVRDSYIDFIEHLALFPNRKFKSIDNDLMILFSDGSTLRIPVPPDDPPTQN